MHVKACYLNTGQSELTDGRGLRGGSAHHGHKRIAGHLPSRDRLNQRRRARGDEHRRSRTHPTQSGGGRDHPEPRRSFRAHVPQLRLSFNALDRDHSCCILELERRMETEEAARAVDTGKKKKSDIAHLSASPIDKNR